MNDDMKIILRVIDHMFTLIRSSATRDPKYAERIADAMHNVGKWASGEDDYFNAKTLEDHLAWFDKKYPEYGGVMIKVVSHYRESEKFGG